MDALEAAMHSPRIMKLLSLVILLTVHSTLTLRAQPRLVFQRDLFVWTAGLDGKGAKKVTKGDTPQISPDGTRVAFATVSDDEKSAERQIAIADLASGKVTVLKQTPSDNCYGPAWSSDGTKLVFNIWIENNWHIGVISDDGSGFALARKSTGLNDTVYAPAWAADGKSFFCHDLDAIYRCDLTGKVLRSWKLAETLEHAGMNSGNRLSPSPDGKRLLMDADMDEEHHRKNWDGPPPAVWSLDLETNKAVRLTKSGHFAWDPAWINDKEFVFISQGAKENMPSLFRRAFDAGEPKFMIKDVRLPSVSR